MKINFITSNVKKALALERALSLVGMEHVKVVPQNLDIIEPQCDTVAEVSKHKALPSI